MSTDKYERSILGVLAAVVVVLAGAVVIGFRGAGFVVQAATTVMNLAVGDVGEVACTGQTLTVNRLSVTSLRLRCRGVPGGRAGTTVTDMRIGGQAFNNGVTVSGTVNIEAVVSGTTDQVDFVLRKASDNQTLDTHTERVAPYFYKGDYQGTPFGWDTNSVSGGEYILVAKPYLAGVAGQSKEVRFTVSNLGNNPPPGGSQEEVFTANLDGGQEVPPSGSSGYGTANVRMQSNGSGVLSMTFAGLSATQTAAHIHGPAGRGANAGVSVTLPNGQVSNFSFSLNSTQMQSLRSGQLYVNVHTVNFPGGEIRGQLGASGGGNPPPPGTTPPPVSSSHGCGLGNGVWHAGMANGQACGHEHGDAPPDWVIRYEQSQGRTFSYDGSHNTSDIENTVKHTSMKGFAATMNGSDVYMVYHFTSNPQERFGNYHSYRWWARPSGDGNVANTSHTQGWNYAGNALSTNDRCFRRVPSLPCEETRPIILVTDQTSLDQGIGCEQWYASTTDFSVDFGITICGSTTVYNRDRELGGDPYALTGVYDQNTWLLTGDLGLTRRLEVGWYLGDSQYGGGGTGRGNPPLDTVFWATQFGERVSGPSASRCQPGQTTQGVDGKTYKNVCLPQYISSAAKSVEFPGNDAQKSYDGTGVKIPN